MNKYFSEKLLEQLRGLAISSEQLRQLHPDLLAIIYQEKWFKLFVPKALGGLQMTLPEAVRLEEALAFADGSLGWTVTLCGGAAWFVGFQEERLNAEIYTPIDSCIAGSGALTGAATILEDGSYLVNGYWKYATGALHATQITANCIIQKDGKPLLDEAGEAIIQSFIFKREDVVLDENWGSLGMIATGSHAYHVQNLNVPANRSFIISETRAVLPDPVFSYPFLQLAEVTLAANISGMFFYFLELAKAIFDRRLPQKRIRENHIAIMQEKWQEASSVFTECHEKFYDALDRSWQNTTSEILQEVSTASHELAHKARYWTDRLYPYCGLEAANTQTEINRVWRDLHTASQHALLVF